MLVRPILLLSILTFFSCSKSHRASSPLESGAPSHAATSIATRKTVVSIREDQFLINGKPTLEGRRWNGISLQGLLPNSRMVQGIFDDLNPETRKRWAYPDTGEWDPDRNTNEFIQNMKLWKQHGLLSFTICLQGGSPEGYSKEQPWINSAIAPDGSLRSDYMNRLEKILDRADELGMIPLVSLFYFGQDERLESEEAIKTAVDNAIAWLFDRNYQHVLIEVNNECNVQYDHGILRPERVHELIERIKSNQRDNKRFLVSTSYGGNTIPSPNVVSVADFILLHGNGVDDPARIKEMVAATKRVDGFRLMPIVFNEDDHFNFRDPVNNFTAATEAGASWGYFDFRMVNEGYEQGFQGVPVDWGINSSRKKDFFKLLLEMTGGFAE